jgi:hypothetical protein
MREKVYVCCEGLQVSVVAMSGFVARSLNLACLGAGTVMVRLKHLLGLYRFYAQIRFGSQGLCLCTFAHLEKASSFVASSGYL